MNTTNSLTNMLKVEKLANNPTKPSKKKRGATSSRAAASPSPPPLSSCRFCLAMPKRCPRPPPSQARSSNQTMRWSSGQRDAAAIQKGTGRDLVLPSGRESATSGWGGDIREEICTEGDELLSPGYHRPQQWVAYTVGSSSASSSPLATPSSKSRWGEQICQPVYAVADRGGRDEGGRGRKRRRTTWVA